MRSLPTSFWAAQTLLGKRDTRKVANNTYVERRADNRIAVRLHRTDVVTFYQEGHIVLNSGGWHTVTTKDRINRCLADFSVGSERGEWLIYGGDQGREWIYEDGVILFEGLCNAKVKERRRRYARRAMLLPSVVTWAEAHHACVDMPAPTTELRRPEDIRTRPRVARRHALVGTRPSAVIFTETGNDGADVRGADDALVPREIADEDESRWAEYNRKFNEIFRRTA